MILAAIAFILGGVILLVTEVKDPTQLIAAVFVVAGIGFLLEVGMPYIRR